MKFKPFAITTIFILACMISAVSVFAFGPSPSWQLTAAPAGVCTDDDVAIPSVEVNVLSLASEQGTLSAPGFPNLGYSEDTSFTGVGSFNFTVFTNAFVLPANTPLTLTITTFNGPNHTGGVAYVSSMTWDCTTGAILSLSNGVPPENCRIPLPANAVMGNAPAGAQIYWGPSDAQASAGNILNPGTYYVIGTDASGEYYKIWLSCESEFWVRADAMQPSYQAPWNGQPLPTNVVS